MENQAPTPNPEQVEKKKDPAGSGHQGRRNRHHHKGKHYNNLPQNENTNAPRIDEAGESSTSAQSETRPAKKENTNSARSGNDHDNAQKQANKNERKRNNDRGRNGHGSRGRNDRNNRSAEKRPYNPYEEPVAEELSLAELRARIVVKASDEKPTEVAKSSIEPPQPEAEIVEELILSPDTAEELVLSDPASLEDEEEKIEIIGVRFRSSGKMYYFDPNGLRAAKGQSVIVETARGPEFGDVCLGNTMIRQKDVVLPLRPILRLATVQDATHNAENREKEKNALQICREKIAAHKLEMKLIDAQYAFDNSKILFYFTADGRVDFRELVKDLASVFRTRIELRQIGIRDEAKLLGGLGACGRPLCCSTFLPDFAQVSIKMAKEQNLSLNSSKISGVCGRLMCCLRFESEVYAEEIKLTPPVDSWVKTEDGVGTVISNNPLAGTVRVILKDSPDTPPKQFHRSEVQLLERERQGGRSGNRGGDGRDNEENGSDSQE